ncbi:MAG TPA: HEAT repeat domain-containing protein [Verrucomicrobiales bacterium]|jgi:HEAT repeat protein|nr:HEAT repeat domain-containing protein [Verrucomicrobiales bacterium]
MLDKAFEALKTYDWGMDPKLIQPIDEAIVSTHGDAAARKDLESRLIAALQGEAPRAAKDAVCRALRTIGTAASVPALAALLADEKLSHMARYALQCIPAPEAEKALAEALSKVGGKLKIGVISSLGVRRSAAAVAPLQAPLADSDPVIARAAACALGTIGSPEANQALTAAKARPETKDAIADSMLECAENLLAAGKKQEAKAAYEKILSDSPSKAVKIAAERGAAACAGS